MVDQNTTESGSKLSFDLGKTLKVTFWTICLIATLCWIFLTSAPSTVGATFVWLGEFFIPSFVYIVYLAWRCYKKNDPDILCGTLASLTLTTGSSWMLWKFVSGLATDLNPLDSEDRQKNVDGGVIWICTGLLMLMITTVWLLAQVGIWWATGTYSGLQKAWRAWMECRNLGTQDGEEMNPLAGKEDV